MVWANNQSKNRKDINLTTLEDLVDTPIVGAVLAGRIITYKFQIDAFLDDIQLKDIYRLN